MVNEIWVCTEIDRLSEAVKAQTIRGVGDGLSLDEEGILSTTKHVFSITPTVGTGGEINPNHKVCVNINDSYTVNFQPAEGYQIKNILVDSEPIQDTSITSYTFTNITADHTIAVECEPKPIFGFIIDNTISSPSDCITWTDQSALLTAEQRKAKTYSWIHPTVVGPDAEIAYFLDKSNLAKKADGTASNLDGTDGDVCASIEKLWMKVTKIGDKIKVQIAEQQYPGYFAPHTFDGTEREYIHLGMFEATGNTVNSVYSTSLNPTANQSMKTFRTQVQTKNTSLDENLFGLETYLTHTLFQALFIHAYGTLDYQTAVGPGFTNSNNTGSTKVARAELLTCNGEYAGTNTTQTMALFVVNPIGNVWEFKEGCVWEGGQFALAVDQSDIFDIELGWNSKPATWHVLSSGIGTSVSQSYIKKAVGDTYAAFFPTAIGGDSASYYTDACWSATGARVCLSGGNWNNAALAGLFTLNVNNAPTNANANIGARLLSKN